MMMRTAQRDRSTLFIVAILLPIAAGLIVLLPVAGLALVIGVIVLAVRSMHQRRAREAAALAERRATWGF